MRQAQHIQAYVSIGESRATLNGASGAVFQHPAMAGNMASERFPGNGAGYLKTTGAMGLTDGARRRRQYGFKDRQ